MYLTHHTTIDNLYKILYDSYLKSNYLTNKINKFIYFGIEKKLFANTNYYYIKLYFNSDLLYNKSFYLATIQTPEPEKEYKYIVNEKFYQIQKKYSIYT